jgi:F420-dependent oxidoreductase-like protein
MRLSLMLGYSGRMLQLPWETIRAAEECGYEAVWTSEAYGSDALTPLAWIGAQTSRIKLGTAILQMPARTPAMTAMSAMSLDQLSGGRFILGLGLSGPQVVEGWHGQPYGKPLPRTREYVEIVRQIFRREQPLQYQGTYYQIPYQGSDATGLGKPLKSILHGRTDLPIYLAAIGPKNVQLVAEIADGWLPIFFSPERYRNVFSALVASGLQKSARTPAQFDILPSVAVVMTDTLEVGYNMLKPSLALYIGGMGAVGKNFYYDLACRYGYEAAAQEIQQKYLAGDKGGAMMAVPDALVDEVALVGTPARIQDRLQRYREIGVNHLLVSAFDVETIRLLADVCH